MTRRTGFVALLTAEITSALGNRISMVALPWLVLVTTGEPAKMGLTAGAELVPYLVAGVLAAPIADRIGLRSASITADLGSALAVGAIAATPRISFALLLVLVAITGTLRGVGDRAKHVLLRPMTEAAGMRMDRVTAAYEGLSRSAMLVGAPAGGLLIYWFSAQGAIFVDAVTFAVCGALVATLVRLPAGAAIELGEHKEPYLVALRGGAQQLWQDRLLFVMITMIFASNVFSHATTAVFIPLWVSEVLRSPAALGLILGSYAGGAVLGSIAFTALAPKLPRYPTFLLGLAFSSAPQVLILLNHNLAVVLTVTFMAGIALAVVNPVLGAMLYERVPAELQNRVFGLVAAVCYAGLPIGGVLGGWAVSALRLSPAILLFGLLCLVVTVAPVLWYRKGSTTPAGLGQATNRR